MHPGAEVAAPWPAHFHIFLPGWPLGRDEVIFGVLHLAGASPRWWIARYDREPGGTMDFDLANGVAVLERTPSVLRSLLSGLSDEWTRADEGPDTWSPFNVVGHLVDGEETDWMVRTRIILAQVGDRRFAPYDRFRHLRESTGKTLTQLLDRFAELRARNLQELGAMELGPAQLRLTGEHPEFGTVTLEQLLATWVAHDLGHLVQVARVMATQYGEAVGPWRRYLSVLRGRGV